MKLTLEDVRIFIKDWNPFKFKKIEMSKYREVIKELHYQLSQLQTLDINDIAKVLKDVLKKYKDVRFHKDTYMYNAELLYDLEILLTKEKENLIQYENKVGYHGFFILSAFTTIIFVIIGLITKEYQIIYIISPIMIGFFFILFIFLNIIATWTITLYDEYIEIKKIYQTRQVYYINIKNLMYKNRYNKNEKHFIVLTSGKIINTNITLLLPSEQLLFQKLLNHKIKNTKD